MMECSRHSESTGNTMKIKLEKATGKSKCRGSDCYKNPEFIIDGKIKVGTTCAFITTRDAGGRAFSYYCRECLEKVHDEVRKTLDPKLWIFS
jgi:hypothetical protein